MLSFVQHIVDRGLFTFFFILGIQCPAFLYQYTQQLTGHFNEAKLQLSQYQTLADLHFQGSLLQLTNHYLKNSDVVINETGKIIASLISRNEYLQFQLSGMTNASYTEQLVFFFRHVDIEIAKQTLNIFSLTVPLTLEALTTGLCIAILVVGLLQALALGLKKIFTKIKPTKVM
ncbi:DUF2937 family protein [Thalassotalea sediminis]|uniref:DUF2937 family protein n=1 Tax=Thalassotalea sediminis TaxID=1759089 RepID=UPI002574012A|nr:DUF2937 family protein [Thalassotalea sediminis]